MRLTRTNNRQTFKRENKNVVKKVGKFHWHLVIMGWRKVFYSHSTGFVSVLCIWSWALIVDNLGSILHSLYSICHFWCGISFYFTNFYVHNFSKSTSFGSHFEYFHSKRNDRQKLSSRNYIKVAPYSFLKSWKHMFQTQNLVHWYFVRRMKLNV